MATDLEKTIDDIQSKLDIAEVISSYIPLKKAVERSMGERSMGELSELG